MQIKNIKLVPILLIIVIGFLQYQLWFEASGLLDMMKLKKELALQEEENAKLKERNENLLSQIQYLKNGKEAVESRARRDLGMIKKGETFYQIVR